jgi:hypothetical protein
MKLAKTLLMTAMLAASSYSQMAHAWGQTGHRVTGQIAQLYLTPYARAAISLILENETLAEISTYADENRSNPDPFWQEVAGPFHYVTVPKGKTYSDVGAPEKGDSYTAIQMYTQALKNPLSSKNEKQLALKMLVHIIGDLHQPLHAGDGTDRGGNDRKVEFFWEDSNLHRVWDSGLIDRKQLSFTEWYEFLAPKISAQQAKQWHTTDPLVYIQESAEIRDTIYPNSDKLSWQYLFDHTPVMEQRLQQAGVRIAAHLNEIYKQ